MNTAFQLHNAARRYCIDQHAHWCSAYDKLNEKGKGRIGSGYTNEALNTFPRYNVLSAILNEIERFDGDKLPEYSELAELLVIAGQLAESLFTKSPTSEIEAAAIQEERDKFVEAVRGFTPTSIAAVLPLPYRRVLSASEVASFWDRTKARWGADGSYFYPLGGRTDLSLRAFDSSAFEQMLPPQRLRTMVRSWGLERVYELREYGVNYLMSIDCWEPSYNGAEGYWFVDSLDWIMYASHEGSITTGGTLTQAVLSVWTDAHQHEWAPQNPKRT